MDDKVAVYDEEQLPQPLEEEVAPVVSTSQSGLVVVPQEVSEDEDEDEDVDDDNDYIDTKTQMFNNPTPKMPRQLYSDEHLAFLAATKEVAEAEETTPPPESRTLDGSLPPNIRPGFVKWGSIAANAWEGDGVTPFDGEFWPPCYIDCELPYRADPETDLNNFHALLALCQHAHLVHRLQQNFEKLRREIGNGLGHGPATVYRWTSNDGARLEIWQADVEKPPTESGVVLWYDTGGDMYFVLEDAKSGLALLVGKATGHAAISSTVLNFQTADGSTDWDSLPDDVVAGPESVDKAIGLMCQYAWTTVADCVQEIMNEM